MNFNYMKKNTLYISLFLFSIIAIILPSFVTAQTLPNPLGSDDIDVVDIMLRIMQIALGVVDVFALFMFILGGFEFLISAGNPERVKKAKDTLIWATVGILVITLSYTVLKYIFEQVSKGFGS